MKLSTELCSFTKIKKCTCDEDVEVSSKEDMVLDQLFRGLQENDWKEKLIAVGDKLTLEKAVKLVEGLEIGKSSVIKL